ncbi:MAG: 3-phosphoshikimate 1-carboxyvinyltransferase [Thermoplasmata archaeon]
MKYIIYPSKLEGKIDAPPSKSYTHRALFIASLSNQTTYIKNYNKGNDIYESIRLLSALGAEIQVNEDNIKVKGSIELDSDKTVICNESGTTARFALALASMRNGKTVIKISDNLYNRNMEEILDIINRNGAKASLKNKEITIEKPLKTTEIKIDSAISSQFVSGLLIASLLKKEEKIHVQNNVSQPYIDMTVAMLKESGVNIEVNNNEYRVNGFSMSKNEYITPGDITNILPFIVGAQLTGGEVEINNISIDEYQPEGIAIEYMKKAGLNIKVNQNSIESYWVPTINGIEASFKNIPDSFPILSILCSYSSGISIFRDIERLKYKESDRVSETTKLLNLTNTRFRFNGNELVIYGKPNFNSIEYSSNDHRMVMAAFVSSLKGKKPSIIHGDTKKSYPDFDKIMKKLNVNLTYVE